MSNVHTPSCFSHHMGLYMVDWRWMENVMMAIKANPSLAMREFDSEKAYAAHLQREPVRESRGLYGITQDGIAIIPMVGLLTKGSNKYGTSTLDVRRALQRAQNDNDVSGIMLHVDSPGGSFAGTDELFAAISKVNQSKPVHVYGEDLIASAAIYAASGAGHIGINAAGEAGSIGTYTVIEDTSGAYELAGVKAHLISTGKYKGLGADGIPITEEHLERLHEYVQRAQGFFNAALIEGRKLSKSQVDSLVADGGKYSASEARDKGLVDVIEPYEDALARLSKASNVRRSQAARRKVQKLNLEPI